VLGAIAPQRRSIAYREFSTGSGIDRKNQLTREVKRVTELILILFRWMVAIPVRAERVLQAGWSVLRQRAASPDGSDLCRRLVPAWIGPQRRRAGWMTYCLAGLDMEGRRETGIFWVPAYAARIAGRRAYSDLSGPVHFNHFLPCSERAPRPNAARLGAHGRSTNRSMPASAAGS
jgi:hypothetical protein